MVKRVLVLASEDSVLNELAEKGANGKTGGFSALIELIDRVEQTAGEVPLREVGRMAAQEAERETIGRVLQHTDWNRKHAARILGISYKTLLQKIRGCGLEPI
jgi:DNA-binding NtrC family response regulator